MNNKEQIKTLVLELLEQSYKSMVKNVDKALDSGAVDIDNWNARMALPKTITTAILENASKDWEGKGTSYEKQIKKDVKNIRYFL